MWHTWQLLLIVWASVWIVSSYLIWTFSITLLGKPSLRRILIINLIWPIVTLLYIIADLLDWYERHRLHRTVEEFKNDEAVT